MYNMKSQYVEADKSSFEVKCGVSQGSILGPLLCRIYRNNFVFDKTKYHIVEYISTKDFKGYFLRPIWHWARWPQKTRIVFYSVSFWLDHIGRRVSCLNKLLWHTHHYYVTQSYIFSQTLALARQTLTELLLVTSEMGRMHYEELCFLSWFQLTPYFVAA